MTEYFPEEKEDEDATFIVSSFNILQPTGGGGLNLSKVVYSCLEPA